VSSASSAVSVPVTRVTAPRALRAKRLVEGVLAAVLLVFASPLILLLALLVQLESRGPVLHRCDRIGFGGRPLRMLKLRKMRPGVAGAPLTGRGDERLTRVGAWLARTRLDELPQLWHVVRGEMALIGPRPEDPRFVSAHAREYDTILCVRPGITGLAQVVFIDEADDFDGADPVARYVERILPRKAQIDAHYALSRTWRLDLRIAAATPMALVRGRAVASMAAEVDRALAEPAPEATFAPVVRLEPIAPLRREGLRG
jgi:lipopolysaccharide/colanic/teichoic acid biosynthesis glycosyltransferase